NALVLDAAVAERMRRARDRRRPAPAVLGVDQEREADAAVVEQVLAPERLLVVLALGDFAALDVADDLPRERLGSAERERAEAAERDLRIAAVALRVVRERAADVALLLR